jgi:hypothetical protein
MKMQSVESHWARRRANASQIIVEELLQLAACSTTPPNFEFGGILTIGGLDWLASAQRGVMRGGIPPAYPVRLRLRSNSIFFFFSALSLQQLRCFRSAEGAGWDSKLAPFMHSNKYQLLAPSSTYRVSRKGKGRGGEAVQVPVSWLKGSGKK